MAGRSLKSKKMNETQLLGDFLPKTASSALLNSDQPVLISGIPPVLASMLHHSLKETGYASIVINQSKVKSKSIPRNIMVYLVTFPLSEESMWRILRYWPNVQAYQFPQAETRASFRAKLEDEKEGGTGDLFGDTVVGKEGQSLLDYLAGLTM